MVKEKESIATSESNSVYIVMYFNCTVITQDHNSQLGQFRPISSYLGLDNDVKKIS